MMMTPSAPAQAPNGETLPATLARVGHRADWRLLTALAVGGSVGAIAVLWIGPRHWVLALPLVLPAMFGAWGLTERAVALLGERGSSRTPLTLSLQVLGALAIAVGVVAFTVLVYAITFVLAGPAPIL